MTTDKRTSTKPLSASARSGLERRRWKFLEAPFDEVAVHFTPHVGCLFYGVRGVPKDLIACGAAEPAMFRKGRKGDPRRRVDSRGEAFRVFKRDRATGRWHIARYIDSLDNARSLPGVAADFAFETEPSVTAPEPQHAAEPAPPKRAPVFRLATSNGRRVDVPPSNSARLLKLIGQARQRAQEARTILLGMMDAEEMEWGLSSQIDVEAIQVLEGAIDGLTADPKWDECPINALMGA